MRIKSLHLITIRGPAGLRLLAVNDGDELSQKFAIFMKEGWSMTVRPMSPVAAEILERAAGEDA